MRTKKIRGEDNLVSSISMAEREEEPEGILTSKMELVASVKWNLFQTPLWHSGGGKKASTG
jgi:hypothetical protein